MQKHEDGGCSTGCRKFTTFISLISISSIFLPQQRFSRFTTTLMWTLFTGKYFLIHFTVICSGLKMLTNSRVSMSLLTQWLQQSRSRKEHTLHGTHKILSSTIEPFSQCFFQLLQPSGMVSLNSLAELQSHRHLAILLCSETSPSYWRGSSFLSGQRCPIPKCS